MQKKGGASTLIETILLIGFVVISMFAVYSWAKSKAKQETTAVISGIASSLECADIRIAASCDESVVYVNNTGVYTIKKMLIRWVNTDKSTGQSFLDTEIKPYKDVSASDNADLIAGREITPMVETNNKLYLCQEKGITIKCS